MKFLFLLITFVFSIQHHQSADLLKSCNEFNTLNTKIRDGKISKNQASVQFIAVIRQLRLSGSNDASTFVFPVSGYNKKSIGGTNGNGYVVKGYDYFDGNLHKAHAAHDIFIIDKNQDCLDDRTHKPVNVLSVSDGVVVAAEVSWNEKSNLRGGKYIWIYSKTHNSLFYYAHNNTISAAVGDKIKAGDVIGTVGRTGLNAFKKRAPTHLHFMQLKINNKFLPEPVNPYVSLTTAR